MLSPENQMLLDVLIKVIVFMLIVEAPPTLLLGWMFLYRWYKKWEVKEDRKAEQIIVYRAKQIGEKIEDIEYLREYEKELLQRIEKLEVESDLDEVKADEAESSQKKADEINYNKYTKKQLEKIAKARGIKGYSRMKKHQLIQLLGE